MGYTRCLLFRSDTCELGRYAHKQRLFGPVKERVFCSESAKLSWCKQVGKTNLGKV